MLQGFSLDINEGETMVIIGYSGSGKSVAIKHIVGLLEPDEGRVVVDDLEVPLLSRRELYALRARIGYVFQFAALFDSLSIGENVAMGRSGSRASWGRSWRDARYRLFTT